MLQEQHLRLAECEAKIYNGIKGFYEAGKALLEIKDGQLYKEVGYESFEDYHLKKWKFAKSQVYRLIDAYSVVKELEESFSPNGGNDIGENVKPIELPHMPLSERQVRPLTKIKDPELRAKVWKEVAEENEEITAKAVEMKVKQYCEPCKVDRMEFRVVTYMNKKYYDKLQELMRGEHEAEYIRRVLVDHCNHPKAV